VNFQIRHASRISLVIINIKIYIRRRSKAGRYFCGSVINWQVGIDKNEIKYYHSCYILWEIIFENALKRLLTQSSIHCRILDTACFLRPWASSITIYNILWFFPYFTAKLKQTLHNFAIIYPIFSCSFSPT